MQSQIEDSRTRKSHPPAATHARRAPAYQKSRKRDLPAREFDSILRSIEHPRRCNEDFVPRRSSDERFPESRPRAGARSDSPIRVLFPGRQNQFHLAKQWFRPETRSPALRSLLRLLAFPLGWSVSLAQYTYR